jgi:hypothetical protein
MRRVGVVLRTLPDLPGEVGAGQQFDQFQRLVEARRDAAAGQPVAVVDEARMVGADFDKKLVSAIALPPLTPPTCRNAFDRWVHIV